jgi:protein-arginine kinase
LLTKCSNASSGRWFFPAPNIMPCEIGTAIHAVALRNVSAERILSNLLEVVFQLISIERDQHLELSKSEKTQIDTKTE